MKSMIKVGALALAIAVTGLENAYGQVSVASNNPPFGSYVGHIGANPNPVEIRHNGNQPIEWYTDSIQRMRLSPNVNSAMGPSNQYPSVNRNGYLLLSNQPDAFTNTASRAPFTRLHLIDSAGTSVNPTVYAQQQGYRLWQRNGVTFTGNSDQSYVGAKYDGNDNSDLVRASSPSPGSVIKVERSPR